MGNKFWPLASSCEAINTTPRKKGKRKTKSKNGTRRLKKKKKKRSEKTSKGKDSIYPTKEKKPSKIEDGLQHKSIFPEEKAKTIQNAGAVGKKGGKATALVMEKIASIFVLLPKALLKFLASDHGGAALFFSANALAFLISYASFWEIFDQTGHQMNENDTFVVQVVLLSLAILFQVGINFLTLRGLEKAKSVVQAPEFHV